MDNTKNESAYDIYNQGTPEKTIGERVEDFFCDYGSTMIAVGTWVALSAITVWSMVMVKKASKNGLVVNLVTPFPVKMK